MKNAEKKREEEFKQLDQDRQAHPLFKKEEITFIRTWEEWKDCWNRTTEMELLIGLLHSGFDIDLSSGVDIVDRICFYLDVAFGCNNYLFFSPKEIQRPYGLPSVNPAEAIAKKAKKVLCQKFFKTNRSEMYKKQPEWLVLISGQDSTILDKIFWFFSEKRSLRFDLDRDDEIIQEFLIAMCEISWECNVCQNYPSWACENLRKKEVRAQLVNILWRLGKLDLLVKQGRFVTEDDLVVLENMVFKKEVADVVSKCRYKTIEEAVADGLVPANILLILRTRLKENARQEKIELAEEELGEAKFKLKQASKG